jgi:hypothetical protein
VAARRWPAPGAAGLGALLLPRCHGVQPTAPSPSRRDPTCPGSKSLPRPLPLSTAVARTPTKSAGEGRCVPEGLRRLPAAAIGAVMCLGGGRPADLLVPSRLACMPPQTRAQAPKLEAGALPAPLCGSRKDPGLTRLPSCANKYQHHKRTLIRGSPAAPPARRSQPWQCRCRSQNRASCHKGILMTSASHAAVVAAHAPRSAAWPGLTAGGHRVPSTIRSALRGKAVFLLHHVAALGQLGDGAVGAAFGDDQAGRDVAQPHARVVGDAQQDPGAVGRETPARHP